MATLPQIEYVKAVNMRNKSGIMAADQIIIKTSRGEYFQSHLITIAFRDNRGRVFLDRSSWMGSSTMGKFRNIFLGEDAGETQKKINRGYYTLVDLNLTAKKHFEQSSIGLF